MFDYQQINNNIKHLYLKNKIPWVIGFSGGKDSTTVLQMIYYALKRLPKEKLNKEIHVISNDTLVENPEVLKNMEDQLEKIEFAGKNDLFKHNPNLFNAKKVTPIIEDSFWVNLIGKGYPSPNRWFRWCTERLKINPTNKYVLETIDKKGKVIIVLGTRKAESSNRAASMKQYNNGSNLKKHVLPNAYVFAPIENLTNHEVWAYLLQVPNPWGYNNKQLFALYRSASDDGECPFVIESGTQSCGKSRFGCWVCTVVDQDKSMQNFVENGMQWMEDLLDFRNWLYAIRQQDYQYVPIKYQNRAKFGPFLMKTRFEILTRLIDLQTRISIELISDQEVKIINKLLLDEGEEGLYGGIYKFNYTLTDSNKLSVFADLDISKTPRQRLGPLSLKSAMLISSKKVSTKHNSSTRVMYSFE